MIEELIEPVGLPQVIETCGPIQPRRSLQTGSWLMLRQPYEVCGEVKADAHHPDHDRPLFVEWLCRKHHRAAHAEMRQGS